MAAGLRYNLGMREASGELQKEIRETTRMAPQMAAAAARRDAEAERRHRELRELAEHARDEKKWREALKRIEAAEQARGRQAEDHFRRGCPEALRQIGIEVDEVIPHRLRVRRRSDREYDLAARNGKIALAGEVKVHFQAKHLPRLRDLVSHFREDHPDFVGDRAVYGVACGLAVDRDAAELARRDGLIVLTLDAKARLVTPRKKGFAPKAW